MSVFKKLVIKHLKRKVADLYAELAARNEEIKQLKETNTSLKQKLNSLFGKVLNEHLDEVYKAMLHEEFNKIIGYEMFTYNDNDKTQR